MRPIKDLLSESFGRPEVLRAARAQIVLRRWPEVVGETMATKVIPDSYKEGIVWVFSESGAWAQELVLHKEVILQRLNEMAGEAKLFRDLRAARPRHRKFDS